MLGRIRGLAHGFAVMVLMAGALLGLSAPARADNGGYPYAGYNGPGSNAASSTWTDASGNPYSPYHYVYRNCTDFVAWKLATVNGWNANVSLGNAAAWGQWATDHDYVVDMNPAVGSVAWQDSSHGGGYGHVAYVVKVNSNSTVDIQEYNWIVNGSFDGLYHTETVAVSSRSGYIHFKDTPPLTVPDLYAINRQDAGSNSTAVHVVNGENWGQYLLNAGTALIPTDQTWAFALGDLNHDGKPDVWAFNRNPNGSNVAVHVLDGTNLNHYLQAGYIALPGVNQDWDFELGDLNHDGTPDVYAINRNPSGIGGHTVVHVINGANWGQYVQVGNVVLPPTDANWDFEVADYNGDGTPDIYAINRQDVGSNSTAVHVVNGANWGQYLLNTGTALIQTDQTWSFALGDLNKDGKPDLWAINRWPGGPHAVVHVLSGANLSQYLQAGNTVLPGVDANFAFEVGAYN